MRTIDSLSCRATERITRIHALSVVLGRPLSYEYLYSCDLRALLFLLEELEGQLCRGAASLVAVLALTPSNEPGGQHLLSEHTPGAS